jgi:uncharacterized membrane protein
LIGAVMAEALAPGNHSLAPFHRPRGTNVQFPPEAILHLSAGTVGLVSGVIALFTAKGERAHRVAGTVFFCAIVTTAGTGVYMGFVRGQVNNAIAGIITLYLVVTALMTVLRPEKTTGRFEIAAFLFAAVGAAAAYYSVIDEMRKGIAFMGGVPNLIFASIIAFAAALDLSVILRRGIAGRQRIARHLWRMHLGFAAAVGSFFPGQLHRLWPDLLKVKPFIVLFTPPFAVLALMLFWLAVVLFTSRFKSGRP